MGKIACGGGRQPFDAGTDAAVRNARHSAEGSYYMYVVQCADGTLYTGYARDVTARIAQHNKGKGAKYTRSRGPVRLAACAEFATQHEALSAEFRFKRLVRSRKLALIARVVEEAGEAAGVTAGGKAPDAGYWDSIGVRRAFARLLTQELALKGRQPETGAPCSPSVSDS